LGFPTAVKAVGVLQEVHDFIQLQLGLVNPATSPNVTCVCGSICTLALTYQSSSLDYLGLWARRKQEE